MNGCRNKFEDYKIDILSVVAVICSSKIGISKPKNNAIIVKKNNPNNCSIRNVQGKFRTVRPLWHPYLRKVINDFF